MTSKEFIIDRLRVIQDKINQVGFTYAYDHHLSYHIIEVCPIEIYDESEDYMKLEMEFKDDFFENFPKEDLLISTNRHAHNMSNIISTFEPVPKVSSNFFTITFEEKDLTGYTFDHHAPQCDYYRSKELLQLAA